MLDNECVEVFQVVLEGLEIQIFDMQYGNWNCDDVFIVMQDYLLKYLEINVVWVVDDDMVVGVLEVILVVNCQDEMWVIGGVGMKEIVKCIMDGDKQLLVNVIYLFVLIFLVIEMMVLYFILNVLMMGCFIIGSQLIMLENVQ